MATSKLKLSGSIPPGIVSHIHFYLQITIGRILWLIQNPPKDIHIHIKWWGEDFTGIKFRISNHNPLHKEKYVEAVYAVRCPKKQFSAYLNDMEFLLLAVYSEKSNFIGTITVSQLNRLEKSKPINGFFPIITSDLTKIATVHIKLVIESASERRKSVPQFTMISSVPQPLKRPSMQQNVQIQSKTLLNTPKPKFSHLPHFKNLYMVKKRSTNEKKPENKKSLKKESNHYYITRDWTLSDNNREAINNSSRTNMLSAKNKRSYAAVHDVNSPSNEQQMRAFSPDILHCISNEEEKDELSMNVEQSAMKLLFGHNKMAAEIQAVKNMQNISGSSDDDSFMSDDDPAHNEAILEDIFYTKDCQNVKIGSEEQAANITSNSKKKNASSVPRVSFEKQISKDDSAVESKLSQSHRMLLSKVRFVRIVIESCTLSDIPSSTKHPFPTDPSSFIIEYQYPGLLPTREVGTNDQLSMKNVRLVAKKINKNMVYFNHRSVFPIKFTDLTLRHWMKLAVTFRLYVKVEAEKAPLLLGTAIFALRSVLDSSSLSLTSNLPLRCLKNLSLEHKLKQSVYNLQIKFDLASDERGYYPSLSSVLNQTTRMRAKNNSTAESKKGHKEHLVQDKNEVKKSGQMKRKEYSKSKIQPQNLNVSNDPLLIMLTISHGIKFELRNTFNKKDSISTGNMRNLYLECRLFDAADVSCSSPCWSSSDPIFNYTQKFPIFLNKAFLERSCNNYMFVEVWEKHISKEDQLIGVCKVPLHQFYLSFKNSDIAAQMMMSKYPMKAFDNYLPVNDIITSQCIGQLYVVLVAGTNEQIHNLETISNPQEEELPTNSHQREPSLSNKANEDFSKSPVFSSPQKHTSVKELSTSSFPNTQKQDFIETICCVNSPITSTFVEHTFIIDVKKIEDLVFDTGSLWGETECFIQYMFPTNDFSTEANYEKVLQIFQTSSVLTTPNLEFHDVYRHTLTLKSSASLPDLLLKLFPSGVIFTVWCKSYQPVVSEVPIAKGLFPISRLNSLITLWKQKHASTVKMKLPLFKLHNWSEIAGFLNITISYSTNKEVHDALTDIKKQHNSVQSSEKLDNDRNSSSVEEVDDVTSLVDMNFPTQSKKQENSSTRSISNENSSNTIRTFTARISIEQAMHLNINTPENKLKTSPNAFVTFVTDNPDESFSTDVIENSTSPQWKWTANVVLPVKFLLQSNSFVLYVWHKCFIPQCTKLTNENFLIGFASVDLTTLTLGMDKIDGWYNIMTYQGDCNGQLKVSIIPLENLSQYKSFILNKSPIDTLEQTEIANDGKTYITSSVYPTFPSHVAQHWEQSICLHSDAISNPSFSQDAISNDNSLPSVVKDSGQAKSFLLNNLRSKFQELSELCARLERQTINIGFEEKFFSGSTFTNEFLLDIFNHQIPKSKYQKINQWNQRKNYQKSFSIANFSIQKLSFVHENQRKELSKRKQRSFSEPCYPTTDVSFDKHILKQSTTAASENPYQLCSNPRGMKDFSDNCSSDSDDEVIVPKVLNNLSCLNDGRDYVQNEMYGETDLTYNIADDCEKKRESPKTVNLLLLNQTNEKVMDINSKEDCTRELLKNLSLDDTLSNAVSNCYLAVHKHGTKMCEISQADICSKKTILCECISLLMPNIENYASSISDSVDGKGISSIMIQDSKQNNEKNRGTNQEKSLSSIQKSRRIAAAIFPNKS